MVIAEMLGVPLEERAQFREWSNRRARILEPLIDARTLRIANEASESLNTYFRSIIQTRRTEPRDDIISALVHVEEEGDRLTEREMLAMLRLLLVAGNETTTNLIGNGMLALLRHPEQLQALRDDPGRIPAAVEELLRYDSPVQATLRLVLEDTEGERHPAAARRQRPVAERRRQPRSGRVRPSPTSSTSGAATTTTWRSAAASTSASARRSRASKGGSPSRCCWSATRRSACSRSGPRSAPGVVLRGLENLPVKAAA